MKDKNKLLFGLFFLFAILGSLSFVSSAISIDLPASDSTLTDIFILNVTNTTGFDTMINCTFTMASALTANTSVLIITAINHTSNNQVNATFNSTFLEDSNDYTLTASCRNQTNAEQTDTSINLVIDNTNPTAPSSITPADKSVDGDGSITFSGTVVGTTTTSCTLQFNGLLPPGGNAQPMTHTGNTCSLTLSSVPDQTYTWFIRASDETDTADSSTIQVTSDVQTSSGQAAILIASGKAKSEGGASFSIIPSFGDLSSQQIIGGLVVIFVLIFFFNKKKK